MPAFQDPKASVEGHLQGAGIPKPEQALAVGVT